MQHVTGIIACIIPKDIQANHTYEVGVCLKIITKGTICRVQNQNHVCPFEQSENQNHVCPRLFRAGRKEPKIVGIGYFPNIMDRS